MKVATARTPVPAERRKIWTPALGICLALVVVTLSVFWPATGHDLLNYDDNVYVTANVWVRGGLTLKSIAWAWWNPVAGNWHPLTVLSHMLDCELFGLQPWGHHLTSVLLHAANTALLFTLLRRLTGVTWRSALVAALFALHPLRVESVAWVAERKDVLSTFFGLLSLICYARYAQARMRRTESGRRDYGLALLFLALGLMSKPMLVTWPCVMLLLDWWPLGRLRSGECAVRSENSSAARSPGATKKSDRGPSPVAHRFMPFLRLAREKIPFFVLAAIASVVVFRVQKQSGAMGEGESLSAISRAGNALVSYCRYLGKLFWPTDLAVFYPHPGSWPVAGVVLAGALLLGLSLLAWVWRRRYPYLWTGWLWYVGTLVPVIGLVQVGAQSMADRYTYVPSVGVLVGVVWGAYDVPRLWRLQIPALSVAAGVAVALCAVLTRQQLGHWRDSEALFRHALAVTGNNRVAHVNLANALGESGRIDEAIRHYQEAIRLKPDYVVAHNNLGNALRDSGRLDEAIRHYREALRLKPDMADVHYNLGIALLDKGDVDEAIRQYEEAIRLKPGYGEAHNKLGAALATQGRNAEAVVQFQEAVRLNPGDADAHSNLGAVLGRLGKVSEAILHLQEAVRLNPGYADAHYNLGAALFLQGRPDEARQQWTEVLRLRPDHAGARSQLLRRGAP